MWNPAVAIPEKDGFSRILRRQPCVWRGLLAGGSGTRPLFVRRSGTSVGAALTAGAAALFLEWGIVRGNYYGMNTEVIRQILIRGARTVVDIAYPNPAWGWGVLDISRAFEALRG